jgi:phage anti-repressor protein
MSIAQKLKWKRALSTLRFTYEEHDYIKEVCSAIAADFQAYYEQYCAANQIDLEKLNREHSERLNGLYEREGEQDSDKADNAQIDDPGDTSMVLHDEVSGRDGEGEQEGEEENEYKMTADETAVHNSFSKLFRQIALKIHPDKISPDLSEEQRQATVRMFTEANKAFEEKKYYILLDIADKLEISAPKNYGQQARWMKKEVAKIQEEVKKAKNTYNYSFSEAETDEQKDIVMKRFVKQLFGV